MGVVRLTVNTEQVVLPFALELSTDPFICAPVLTSVDEIVLEPNMLRNINVHLSASSRTQYHNQMLEFHAPDKDEFVCQNAVLPVHKDRQPILVLQLANPTDKAISIKAGTVVAIGKAVDLNGVQAFVKMEDDDDDSAGMADDQPAQPSGAGCASAGLASMQVEQDTPPRKPPEYTPSEIAAVNRR